MLSEQFLLEITLSREKVDSFDSYPFSLNAVKSLRSLALHPAVTFLIGENGSGKSTLLESIAVAWGFNPEGGSRSFRFGTRSSHSVLCDYILLVRGVKAPTDGFFLRAESFFNVATEIEQLDEDFPHIPRVGDAYGARSLHEQSHGEAFLSLMLERFRGNGLYLLDEPEAALSPNRQMTVLSRIHQLVDGHSQLIIATHSPILMAYPDAYIYQLADDGIHRVEYTDTEHYAVTRSFLNNHTRMLDILLGQ
jgi:predicted ATPase